MAEDAVSPALPDPVLVAVPSVVPTVTSKTVSAITTVTALSNTVYKILKQAQVDKTQANVAKQHPIGEGDNLFKFQKILPKENKHQDGDGKALAKGVMTVDNMIVKVILALVMILEVWQKSRWLGPEESTCYWRCQKAIPV